MSTHPEMPPIMTLAEVAAYLRMAESTVYRLAKTGKIPGQRIGGQWRFLRTQIEALFGASPHEKLPSEPA